MGGGFHKTNLRFLQLMAKVALKVKFKENAYDRKYETFHLIICSFCGKYTRENNEKYIQNVF